ncbi:MaoC/PaaZ C-terminal domain-containing protein [Solimonas sp. K1W22B-7]|uniref:MaoC/PaaZ C-terminal domain-containing protein n=1 Tax=Solimonas sp. K1W22B-7 TaxID=2303331 RepID=UPI0013C4A572|nr:MaoC/PaaZ C-terminal domain-containing protein [Solimonas sp. K1W22B-7]
MSLTTSLTLAREQIPTLVTSFGVALRSMSPLTRPRRVPETPQPIVTRFAAPSDRLVDAYAAWAGAPPERYRDVLPPHFCSHWAFAMLARVGGQAPYDVTSILNQGLRLQLKAALPRGAALQLRGQLQDVSEDAQRVRIHSRVIAGWAQQPEAVIVDSYAAIPKRAAAKAKAAAREEPAFETVGHWSVAADDGLNFALVTGDFNPIHTFWPLARRTKFRGCILHGFGSVARTWEVLADAGHDIADIDLRFVKPLPLPNEGLQVQVAAPDAEGRRAFRLLARDGSVHLAGSFLLR